MDKVNKQELARLIGSLEAYAKIAKPEYQWMPQTVFALLDELERAAERNVALGAELEQYRKDALRYRFIADNAADVIMSASATDCGDGDTTFGPRAEIDLCQYPVEIFGSAKMKLDFAVDAAMAKEGGANG